jgi:hypothetical protein
MSAKNTLKRREFIRLAASAAAVGSSVSCGEAVSPWRSLTADEADTLANLYNQIIPQDQGRRGSVNCRKRNSRRI